MTGAVDRPRVARRLPRAWALFKMSRPSQLLLIVAVYALGATIALATGSALDRAAAAAGAVALVPTAASVHYANEYADYETDARTERTPFSGGSGALHRTGLPRGLALRAAAASLAVGALLAAGLLAAGTLPAPAAAVLAAITVLGWQYSLPPLALAWHGAGELDNTLLGGLVLPHYGAAAVAGELEPAVCLAVVPFTALVFVNLLETQWPDRRADAAVGKDTLVTRLSPATLRGLYVAGGAVAFGSLAALTGAVIPPSVAWPTALAVPLVAWGAVRYTRREAPFPAVAAMVLVAVVQLVAWARVAGLVRVPL